MRYVVVALSVFLAGLGSSLRADEFLPLEHRNVPPMIVKTPASYPPGPAPLSESPEHYAVSAVEYEQLQEFALSDPDAPRADVIVPIAGVNTDVTQSSARLGILAPASAVVTSFAGLDYSSSGSHVPPDTTIAKSGSNVLEATNSALRLFSASGTALATIDTATFVGLSPGTGMTDPKVFFDANATNKRFWVVVEKTPSFSPQSSSVYVAISRMANPGNFSTANWCVYWFNSVATIGGESTFADSPVFGIGADTFVLTTNQYSFSTGLFRGVVVDAGDKLAGENNATSCPVLSNYVFQPGVPGDSATFTLMPTQHYTSPSSFAGTTNPAYLISTNGAGGSVYSVWRVRNIVSGAPSLVRVDVPGTSYQTPPQAPQPPGHLPTDEGDVRIRQVAGIGDSLWATHTTNCTVGSGNQGCIRVLRFDVGQDGSGNPTAVIGQQTTFIGPSGVHYWMPGIASTSSQTTIVPFLYSSTSTFLSSAFTVKTAAASSYAAATTFATGGCGSNTRTGDYQGAQTNPNDLASFWIAGEATPVAGSCSSLWRTQIANVTP